MYNMQHGCDCQLCQPDNPYIYSQRRQDRRRTRRGPHAAPSVHEWQEGPAPPQRHHHLPHPHPPHFDPQPPPYLQQQPHYFQQPSHFDPQSPPYHQQQPHYLQRQPHDPYYQPQLPHYLQQQPHYLYYQPQQPYDLQQQPHDLYYQPKQPHFHPLPPRSPPLQTTDMQFDMNAPVIRMGMNRAPRPDYETGYGANTEPLGNRRGAGLGFDGHERDMSRQPREAGQALVHPTQEEVFRTIMITNIPPGCRGENGVREILSVGGGLRQYYPVLNNDYQDIGMGFAEYRDVDSLAIALELLTVSEIRVPRAIPVGGQDGQEDRDEETVTLRIIADPQSVQYAQEWRGRSTLGEDEYRYRLETATHELARVVHNLFLPVAPAIPIGISGTTIGDGDLHDANGDTIHIPVDPNEDPLAHVPEEHRENVRTEIRRFRDRATQSELARTRQEERVMSQENRERAQAPGVERERGTGGIPVGPRAMQGAPAGPRALHDGRNAVVQDSDYDTDLSDETLERRRRSKKNRRRNEAAEAALRDIERREARRIERLEAELRLERNEQDAHDRRREQMRNKLNGLTDWDENNELYRVNPEEWARTTLPRLERERENDAAIAEAYFRRQQEQRNRELGVADQFLAEHAQGTHRQEPQRVRINLGAGAQRAQAAVAPRRTFGDNEGLLDDEDDDQAATARRTLRPIQPDVNEEPRRTNGNDRDEAFRRLSAEIPRDGSNLWSWPIVWKEVNNQVVERRLRDYVSENITRILEKSDDFVVDMMLNTIKARSPPQELEEMLMGFLEDDEAKTLVKSIWRFLIIETEAAARGLDV